MFGMAGTRSTSGTLITALNTPIDKILWFINFISLSPMRPRLKTILKHLYFPHHTRINTPYKRAHTHSWIKEFYCFCVGLLFFRCYCCLCGKLTKYIWLLKRIQVFWFVFVIFFFIFIGLFCIIAKLNCALTLFCMGNWWQARELVNIK